MVEMQTTKPPVSSHPTPPTYPLRSSVRRQRNINASKLMLPQIKDFPVTVSPGKDMPNQANMEIQSVVNSNLKTKPDYLKAAKAPHAITNQKQRQEGAHQGGRELHARPQSSTLRQTSGLANRCMSSQDVLTSMAMLDQKIALLDYLGPNMVQQTPHQRIVDQDWMTGTVGEIMDMDNVAMREDAHTPITTTIGSNLQMSESTVDQTSTKESQCPRIKRKLSRLIYNLPRSISSDFSWEDSLSSHSLSTSASSECPVDGQAIGITSITGVGSTQSQVEEYVAKSLQKVEVSEKMQTQDRSLQSRSTFIACEGQRGFGVDNPTRTNILEDKVSNFNNPSHYPTLQSLMLDFYAISSSPLPSATVPFNPVQFPCLVASIARVGWLVGWLLSHPRLSHSDHPLCHTTYIRHIRPCRVRLARSSDNVPISNIIHPANTVRHFPQLQLPP